MMDSVFQQLYDKFISEEKIKDEKEKLKARQRELPRPPKYDSIVLNNVDYSKKKEEEKKKRWRCFS